MKRYFLITFLLIAATACTPGSSGMGGFGAQPINATQNNGNAGAEEESSGGSDGALSGGDSGVGPNVNQGGVLPPGGGVSGMSPMPEGPVDIPVPIAKTIKPINEEMVLVSVIEDENFEEINEEVRQDRGNVPNEENEQENNNGANPCAENCVPIKKKVNLMVKGLPGAVADPELTPTVYVYHPVTKEVVIAKVEPDGSFEEVIFDEVKAKSPIILAPYDEVNDQIGPPLVLKADLKNFNFNFGKGLDLNPNNWLANGKMATSTSDGLLFTGGLKEIPVDVPDGADNSNDSQDSQRVYSYNQSGEKTALDTTQKIGIWTIVEKENVFYRQDRLGIMRLTTLDRYEKIVDWGSSPVNEESGINDPIGVRSTQSPLAQPIDLSSPAPKQVASTDLLAIPKKVSLMQPVVTQLPSINLESPVKDLSPQAIDDSLAPVPPVVLDPNKKISPPPVNLDPSPDKNSFNEVTPYQPSSVATPIESQGPYLLILTDRYFRIVDLQSTKELLVIPTDQIRSWSKGMANEKDDLETIFTEVKKGSGLGL